MEDLNHLLHREQVELLRAQATRCVAARDRHRLLARGYSERIRAHRLPYRSGAVDSGLRFAPHPFGGEGWRS